MDVVSLLPGATETLYALGVEPAAVTHECNYPPGALDLPRVTSTEIDTVDRSSSEIDNEIQSKEGTDSIYSIDTELLREIDPDLILTQGVCDVCAVDTEHVDDALSRIDIDPVVLELHPHDLDDILMDIERVGEILEKQNEADKVLSNLEGRIEELESETEQLNQPSVCVIEWMDPLIVAGHWTPTLISKAGGHPVFTDSGDASKPIEFSELHRKDPDVIIVAPCGFRVNQSLANFSELADRPRWNELTAVKNERVIVMDGDSYFNRPGPRIVDSMEYLAMAIHPQRYSDPPGNVASKPIRIR